MQFKEIPRKLIVAKRLAQCLNPALPTGVHQRALDVYTHVLAVLGVCLDLLISYSLRFNRPFRSPKVSNGTFSFGVQVCSRSLSVQLHPSR